MSINLQFFLKLGYLVVVLGFLSPCRLSTLLQAFSHLEQHLELQSLSTVDPKNLPTTSDFLITAWLLVQLALFQAEQLCNSVSLAAIEVIPWMQSTESV